jgi:LacI family transcriptional regulator
MQLSKSHRPPQSKKLAGKKKDLLLKSHRRPTIFDLVDYIGMSRGTISRAFNNQAGISIKTREMVLKAAAEIGYTPHNGARLLKLRRTRRWGLLLPYLHNPHYPELVEALSHEARKRRTTLLLGLSNYETAHEAEIIKQWVSGETDGIILDQGHYPANAKLFQQLAERGVPVLFLHGQHGQAIPDFDFVCYDLHDNFLILLNHLDALGHEKIGYVGQNFPFCRNTVRFRAYLEFHQIKGREIDERYIYFGGEDAAQCGNNAWRAWQNAPDRPTAVACFDDIIACGLIHAVRSTGGDVPEDLSVAGVDDIAEAVRLGLTTIRTDRVQTANEILDLLEKRLESPARPPETKLIPSALVVRGSIGRPRT